ncbi:MAG: MBL fold metallo-hydrolase [Alphaproteobacteria bacterium]
MTKIALAVSALFIVLGFLTAVPTVQAAPCLTVTLTGTSGPPPYNGLAGPGTFVRYGDDTNNCGSTFLQFDVGRGTLMRLSQVGVQAAQLDAVFFTHIHSDHVEGFSDVAQMRWLFGPRNGPKLDVVCSTDAKSPSGFVVSCSKFVAKIDDAYRKSGETAQRLSEDKNLSASGPLSRMNVITFKPMDAPRVVWTSGEVKVSAIQSAHMPGHASYRVDTPAGSVVIGGDAVNGVSEPLRRTSTSDEVEKLAKGADIIVHSAVHPILAPEKGSGMPPLLYYRQSNATDLGAMAKRAGGKYLMLTHLGPPLGAETQGPWKIPGGALTEADYRKAVEDSGYTGNVVVGTDLASVRLPEK